MFSNSFQPVKAIFKIYGVCTVKTNVVYSNSRLITSHFSLASFPVIFWVSVAKLTLLSGELLRQVLNLKKHGKYSMQQSVCLSCYFELQQAQMEVTVGHIILAVRILKVYYTLFPTKRCALLAASTHRQYNKPAFWAVNFYGWKTYYINCYCCILTYSNHRSDQNTKRKEH